jgi:lysyl-tRNA synthetase class 1
MDGLRKVPDNIPNDKVLKDNLRKTSNRLFQTHLRNLIVLVSIIMKCLKNFLNKFNFKFIFKSSTENYKSGIFNNSLLRVLEKYEDIMNIILPTLEKNVEKLTVLFYLYVQNWKSFRDPIN